tara:strand:- start:55 stop:1386 length:1332 start_codon:yes stop_codon:yes gene_type:complete
MLNFKQYLAEQELLNEGSTSASTLFETVIVDCYNLSSESKSNFKKKILDPKLHPNTLEFISKAKKKFAVVGLDPIKDKAELEEIFWHWGRLCKEKITIKGTATSAGADKLPLGGFWKSKPLEGGGTGKAKDTSKADIMIDKVGVSVKGPAANIMSGKMLEAKATVITAMADSKDSTLLKNKLLNHISKFANDIATEGAELDATTLKKADPKTLSPKMKKIQTELLKKGDTFKINVENDFHNAFNTKAVRDAFAYEAMSGREKFSGAVFGEAGATEGEATHMLIWDYDMKKLKFYKITDKLSDVAEQMKMQATLKSSRRVKTIKVNKKSKQIKVGYNIYQSMRLTIDSAMDEVEDALDTTQEQIERTENLLTEGMIDEIAFKNMIGKAWNWFKNKVSKIWNWVKEQLSKIKETFLELWEDGLGATMSYFGLDVEVKVNNTIKLK